MAMTVANGHGAWFVVASPASFEFWTDCILLEIDVRLLNITLSNVMFNVYVVLSAKQHIVCFPLGHVLTVSD